MISLFSNFLLKNKYNFFRHFIHFGETMFFLICYPHRAIADVQPSDVVHKRFKHLIG